MIYKRVFDCFSTGCIVQWHQMNTKRMLHSLCIHLVPLDYASSGKTIEHSFVYHLRQDRDLSRNQTDEQTKLENLTYVPQVWWRCRGTAPRVRTLGYVSASCLFY